MHPRLVVQLGIRGLALLLAVSGMLVLALGVSFWLLKTQSFSEALRIVFSHPIDNMEEELIVALPLLVFAAVLWIVQKPVARLIVPRFERSCPECGYSMRKLTSARCPECGTALSNTASIETNPSD